MFLNSFFNESNLAPVALSEDKIVMEMPGIEKEDVNVSLKDGLLSIFADKKGYNAPYSEIYSGEINRSFKVGDVKNIEARLKNGVLVIDLKKIKEKPKKIHIN
jgi:HSP20 family protein